MPCILKALLGWIILLLVGTNLIGFFIRGLVHQSVMRKANKPLEEIIPNVTRKDNLVDSIINILSGAACIGYLYLLLRRWGWPVAVSGFVLMVSRLPDLFYEMRTSKKVRLGSAPKGLIYTIANVLIWLTVPLVIWGVCYR